MFRIREQAAEISTDPQESHFYFDNAQISAIKTFFVQKINRNEKLIKKRE